MMTAPRPGGTQWGFPLYHEALQEVQWARPQTFRDPTLGVEGRAGTNETGISH